MTVRFAKSLTPLLVPIEQVQEHPDNPNHGDDKNLMEMIEVHGFVTAVTADAKTGYITAGNTRLRALKALGATQIPVIWEDTWDESGAKRFLVGDNASSRRAIVDTSAEMDILKKLMDSDTGLKGTGITEDEFQQMLLESALPEVPEGAGFGVGAAPLGLYQIIIEFKDDPDRRDEVYADLAQVYDSVRTQDL